MSANIDISQFFVPDESDQTVEDVSQFFEPEEPSGIGRDIGRSAKVVGSSVLGIPGDITNFLGNLTHGAIQKLSGERLPEYEKVRPFLSMILPGANLPTSGEIKKKIEDLSEGFLTPQTPGEEKYEEALELLTALATPGPGGKIKPIRALLGTALGMGAKELAQSTGQSSGVQEAAKFITSLIPLIAEGKIKPTSEEAKKLYEAGKSVGLSDKQLTPLLQSEKKIERLGKFARQNQGIRKSLAATESKLSDVYRDVKLRARELPHLSFEEAENLTGKFADVIGDLRKTLKAAPDKEGAIKFIEEAIERVNNHGATPEELINFYQDINKAVNWNAIKGGKKDLQRIKEPILEALRKANPQVANEFEASNKLWSKLKNFQEQVGYGKFEKWLTLGEAAAFLGNLMVFNIPGLVTTAGAEAGRQIATKLLTDPKWQGIHRNILNSIKNNNRKLAAASLNQLKQQVKEEFPEEYEEIKWPEF